MLQNAIKILVFVALIGGFLYFASGVPYGDEFWAVRRAQARAVGWFIVGAAVAVWGNKEIGALDPLALRGAFIALGISLMVFATMLIYALREPAAWQ